MSAIDHDEIYLQPVCCVNEDVGRLWCEDDDTEYCEDGKRWTRYVRADIHEAAVAELEALRQERDGLRADAVRYRWLRSNNVGPSQIEKVSDDCNPPYFTLKCEGELDAAIDAAMAKEQGDGN